MSDPMSNHEIEDVLSSIRRLVSEDLRPGAMRSRIPVDNDADRAEARLILTPALRVIQRAAAEAAEKRETDWDFEALVPEVPAAPKPPVTEDLRNDRLRAAATIAFPSASATLPGLFQSRRGDVEFHSDDDDSDLEERAAPVTSSAEARDPEPPPDVMIWEDDAFDEATLQARRQDLMMAAEDETGDLLADVTGPVGQKDAPQEPLTGEIIETAPWAPMWSDVPEGGAAWSEVDPAWEASADPPPPQEAAARVRLVENPLARAWADRLEETLRAELDAEFRGPELEAESRPEAENAASEAEPAAEPGAAAQPVSDDAFAEMQQPEDADTGSEIAGLRPSLEQQVEEEVARDLRQFDEDLLRELVREVLREELAGALGERITRNVRKLVRMEINRTLSTGEFQ